MRTLGTGRTSRSRRAGFTLIEMLLSITISGILLVAAYGLFSAANRTTRTLDAQDARMQSLTNACAVLQQDLAAALPQAAREEPRSLWNANECRFRIRSGSDREGWVHFRQMEATLEREFEPSGPQNDALPGGVQAKSKRPIARGIRKVVFSYYAEGDWRDGLRPKQWPEMVRARLVLGEANGTEASFLRTIRVETR